MKKEDFNRLKKLCNDNGFMLLNETPELNDKCFLVVKKKDIWEGVEFAEDLTVSGIVKITPEMGFIKDSEGTYIFKKLYKPSTEQAYKEQLKAKAFELFGEIKEGDRFDNPKGNIDTRRRNPAWVYNKYHDWLYYGTVMIYQKGKWAKKEPKRIEVEFVWADKRLLSIEQPVVAFYDKVKHESEQREVESVFKGKPNEEIRKAFEFLAKQLEKYLNKEIE